MGTVLSSILVYCCKVELKCMEVLMTVSGIQYVLVFWVLLINIIIFVFISLSVSSCKNHLNSWSLKCPNQEHLSFPLWVMVRIWWLCGICDSGWQSDHSLVGIMTASFFFNLSVLCFSLFHWWEKSQGRGLIWMGYLYWQSLDSWLPISWKSNWYYLKFTL